MFHSSRNLKQGTQKPHTSKDKAEDTTVTHFTRAGLKAVSYCHLRSILSAMCISLDLWKAGRIFIAVSRGDRKQRTGVGAWKVYKGLGAQGSAWNSIPQKNTKLKKWCLGNSWFSTDIPWLTPPLPVPFPTPALSHLSKSSGSFPFCSLPVLVQARAFFSLVF